jgi:hypothetical protein
MNETQKKERKSTLDNIASVITNKRSRSLMFLVLTFILILLANGLLPLISGQAHYTVTPVDVTYGEYVVMKAENPLVELTYASRLAIERYRDLVIERNPDFTPDELVSIRPPDNLQVSVYTEFFFQSVWWYFETGLSMASAILLFYALFNYLIVRAKDTRVEHVNGEHTIKQLNEKYLDPDTFEPWIDDVFNRERKIKQHIRNVKYELKKLETDTPFAIRKRFKKYFLKESEDSLLPVAYQPLTKQEHAYVNRKEELTSMLTPEYLKEYVEDTEIDNFKPIRAGFVYSGVEHNGVGQDEYSTIKTDRARIRSSILSKVLILLSVTLGFASILTVLAVDVHTQSPLWVGLTILMKLTPLFLQVYFAIDYTNWFMENQLLPNLKFRENIALLYLAEMKRRGVITENITLNKLEIPRKESV